MDVKRSEPVMVRLEPSTKEKLVALARTNNRSLSAEAALMIRTVLATQGERPGERLSVF